ncbi:MAG TPA: phosphatase PAP2 family protein [Gaiellaceae bacterium]|nr:phosphatase PAP2 family protein [Gaiellaceae bacterium]
MLVPLLLGAVLAASVGSVARLRRFVVGLLVDWTPLLLALWAYDLARGLGSHNWFPVHYRMQIDLDRVIGVGSVPTVWLQHHLWHGAAHIQWYDYASLAVYVSFFFATPVVLVSLWWFRPAEFRRFAVTLVALALAACATFLLFPTQPPWLAAQNHHIPPVAQLIGTLNLHLPLLHLDPLWERGTGYANVVAAVPSLHAGQTLLISLFFWRRLRTPWRHLLWLYPLAMSFALVYAGEHYVSDILFGFAYCVVVYFGVERAWGWRRARRLDVALGPA